MASDLRVARTSWLEIAYHDHGPPDGPPAVLLHGFPYDVRAFDEVVPLLTTRGWRVVVPYLRGYGPTRFLSAATPRSGQQAALGQDVRDLLDALGLPTATLGGYDWGGRGACIAAALWPARVAGLVTVGGYNLQDIAASSQPADPVQEHRLWYQYYFHTERGRAGLQANRYALGKLLWQLWSPTWQFDEATYARTAASFDNPDFVEVVIQSYRHRYGYAPGDPNLESIEAQLAAQPSISVPTVNLVGADDGVTPTSLDVDASAWKFTGPYVRRVVPRVGHNLPQEAPAAVAQAMLDVGLLGRA
jgi:pimeloyl-ACP methyl ester carboxylesterase